MAFEADVLVMARDVPDLLLVAEVKRDLGDIADAETQLRQYMLARRCSLGLLVTPEHTRIYRDTFANFTEGSVQLVGVLDGRGARRRHRSRRRARLAGGRA